ncbi:hypothetical protein BMS3Abin10_01206 [bacterium BMS3Abin10]|nr:hypothetical protein BMS3Abin10_01206 [bacterium BMS3Abin10]GBE38424.1 hypothetical protein BMS3Bbin08_01030 [bacterium BMS3Bbin08]
MKRNRFVIVGLGNIAQELLGKLSRDFEIVCIDAMGMSLILSAHLSLMVAAGTLGEKMGLITNDVKGSLFLAAVITGIIYPFMFRLTAGRKPAATSSSTPLQPS